MSRIAEHRFDSGHLQTYTYDVFGSLTGITTTPPGGGSVPRSLPVLGLTNRLSGGVYDAAGNLTTWGAYTYQYDAFGMMTRMLGAGNDNTHLYTADDERLWAIDFVLGGGEAGATQTFRLRDSDAQVLREYRLLGTNVAGHWSQVKDYIYRDGGNLLASISPSAGTVHYTLDHLGTPRLATNATGAYLSDHHYYAYGEELNTREQFQDRLNARGAPALFAVSLLAPGPEDVILAAAAGKLLGRVGTFFARIFGKADEAADAAKMSGKAADAASDLSAEAQKGIRSLEKQITDHQQKLEAYKRSPDGFDNQGRLADAPSAAARQQIIDGRIKKLQSEIRRFQREIEKLKRRDRP